MSEILDRLRSVEGVTAAVVVGRDGFVIDAVGGSGIDVEGIGAIIATGFGSSETMGKELNIGRIGKVMAEFEEGVLMGIAIGQDAILAVVTSSSINLGNIRYQVKKYIPELEDTLGS